jgi:hypothetical protein
VDDDIDGLTPPAPLYCWHLLRNCKPPRPLVSIFVIARSNEVPLTAVLKHHP